MRLVGVAAVAALFALSMTRAEAAEPYHLRIGWVVVPSDIVPLMFLKPGLAPHAGKTYVPELTHFAGTSTEMTAFATGALDCGALAYSTLGLGIENAGMDDLRVIADTFQDGVPGYHTNNFVVRKDSPIHSVEDLKGKILASNETGSAVDIALRAMLAKHGLKDKRDVTIIEVRFPEQKAMLEGGQGRSDYRGGALRLRSGAASLLADLVHPGASGRPHPDDRAGGAGRVSRKAPSRDGRLPR